MQRYRLKAGPTDEAFTQEELCGIWDSLSHQIWCPKLGEKPRDPCAINRIVDEIATVVPRYHLLKHHHIRNLGATAVQFDHWWLEETKSIVVPNLLTSSLPQEGR